MGSLDGKRVIVTGGAGGIGNAAVIALHAAGARVACTFNAAKPDLPDGVHSERCDITSKGEIDHAFDTFARALGGLDVLIHAAGIHGSCPAEQLTEEGWDRMMALNGRATMLTNQAAFRHMQSTGGGGSIVNMGSVEGVRGYAGNAAYAASRGAVMAWTRSVALEWGRHGIRANCVAPVVFTGPAERMRAKLDDATNAMIDAHLAQAIPLGGKMGDALRDLAPVLVFLASDASHFITGQTLSVDGGFMMLGS
jgi:NAD(P)-dependent dehydrogenase (short-subunit alcohol dehydrogenase family)